jgi:hypothetical protein
VYLASDSRLSWSDTVVWDGGRKLFAARTKPHIFGYCGEVLFPTQVLSQLVEMIDYGLLDAEHDRPDVWNDRVVEVIVRALRSYPASAAANFELVHAMREGVGLSASFHVHAVTFRGNSVQSTSPLAVPQASAVINVRGSGAEAFKAHLHQWQQSDVKGTSRAVFSALTDTLRAGADPRSGGPPQLIGLYRAGGGRTFGVISGHQRFWYGTPVADFPTGKAVQWHNDLFEVCDPLTVARHADAQPQPRPRGV